LIGLGLAIPLAAPLAAMGFCLGSSRYSGRSVSEAVLTEMMLWRDQLLTNHFKSRSQHKFPKQCQLHTSMAMLRKAERAHSWSSETSPVRAEKPMNG
jgi:hypothetical protein